MRPPPSDTDIVQSPCETYDRIEIPEIKPDVTRVILLGGLCPSVDGRCERPHRRHRLRGVLPSLMRLCFDPPLRPVAPHHFRNVGQEVDVPLPLDHARDQIGRGLLRRLDDLLPLAQPIEVGAELARQRGLPGLPESARRKVRGTGDDHAVLRIRSNLCKHA